MERSDSETVADYMVGLTSPRREICEQIRELLTRFDPPLEELWRWGRPIYRLDGKYVCYFVANKADVNLGFEAGAQLADPKGLLMGTGKTMRHLKLKALADLDLPYCQRLLEESVKHVRQQTP